MGPGLDIGIEYFYRKKFKEKCKSLYGFDYDKAEKLVNQKQNDSINLQNNTVTNETFEFTDDDFDKRTSNIKLEESKIDLKIDEEISNKGRNAGTILRGAGEIGGIVIKALPTAGVTVAEVGIEAGVETAAVVSRGVIAGALKIGSWVLLPLTCIAFGTWSLVNIHKDCHKILDIFDKAFTPLRFETLFAYIKSYRAAIKYLEFIGQKIIKDDEEENECY